MTLTAQQLELRQRGIGSSEIAAVVGVHPYSRPIDVWLRKTGREVAPEPNELMEQGHDLEPIICRRALRKLGLRDARYGETRVHPQEPLAVATPDWLLPERPAALLETKNVGYRVLHHWGDEEDDRGAPLYYLAQVQWQMEVWDREVVYLAAWMGGRETRVIEVRRDREVGAALLDAARRFWTDHVVADVQPAVDGSPSSERWLRKRFGQERDTVLRADAETERLVADYREACAAEARTRAAMVLAQQRVMAVMQDNAVLEGDGWRIAWRSERGRVAWKAVADALGATAEISEKHRGDAVRRFRPPRGWAKTEEE